MIWHGFLRKMVRGGFERKNAPSRKDRRKDTDPNTQVEGDLDWSYNISNEQLRCLTNTLPIRDFRLLPTTPQVYRSHICRLDNSEPQKQVLFDTRTPRRIWNRIERLLDIDVQQARRTMIKRNEYMRLLDQRFKQERPKPTTAPSGKRRRRRR